MSDRIAIMNKGRLEQLGTPREIYESPTTRYVADFIGETNFLEGRVTATDAGWTTVSVNNAFTVRAPSIEGVSKGQNVTIAIRPEKINVESAQQVMQDCVPGQISEVVYIGTDTRYIVQLGGGASVVARVQNLGKETVTNFAPGVDVALTWEPSAARILTA